MTAGPNVFICEDRVVLCTEAVKDESDDPRIHGATGAIDLLR